MVIYSEKQEEIKKCIINCIEKFLDDFCSAQQKSEIQERYLKEKVTSYLDVIKSNPSYKRIKWAEDTFFGNLFIDMDWDSDMYKRSSEIFKLSSKLVQSLKESE